MRAYFFAFIGFIIAIAGYAFATNPVGCKKLISDAFSLGTSVSPVHITSGGGMPMAPLINDKLVSADGSSFSFPDSTSAEPIQYYAIYYSAQDDEPSRTFTPALVKWYKKFKLTHRNFELIFVSKDPDKATMLSYMKQTAMPWPAFRYDDLLHDGQGIEKFAGNGMPDLVLVDTDGKVLSDSFNWSGTNLGPQHVLDDIATMVPASAPPAPPKPVVTFNASLPPVTLWAPPSTIPAQPNWTWTMQDGTVYQNVVVTGIEADTVTITHSLGVAHLSTDLVPTDIQKQINYDPAAAACARRTPYSLASYAQAEIAAQDLNRPLAWLAAPSDCLSMPSPTLNSEAYLCQMALAHIKPQAIVVLIDDPTALDTLPAAIRDQFLQPDDGPQPSGRRFAIPKMVFSTPDATKILGRVTYKQMKDDRELAIDSVLTHKLPQPQDTTLATTDVSPAAASSNSTTDSTSTVTNSITIPVKPWAPPEVMPAQPNWTWTTMDGQTYQNVVVTKIEPATVSITHSMGVAHIAINTLPPDIQKQLNYDPHAASQLTALIDGKLISADGAAATTPDASVQYYAVYYSAQWCPPCHAFSPRLVKWYNAFKPGHPNFELIFVSEDHNADAMLDYMKEMAMPWPAVRFGDLLHDGNGTFRGSGIEKFAGDGIPDLVLLDASGKVLSDSYQNGTYVGPEAVIDDINKIVGGTSPTPLVHHAPASPTLEAALLSTR